MSRLAESDSERLPLFGLKRPDQILAFVNEKRHESAPLGVLREAVENIDALLADKKGLRQYGESIPGDLALARHRIQTEIDRLEAFRSS